MTSCAQLYCSSSKLVLCAQQGQALTARVLVSCHDCRLGFLYSLYCKPNQADVMEFYLKCSSSQTLPNFFCLKTNHIVNHLCNLLHIYLYSYNPSIYDPTHLNLNYLELTPAGLILKNLKACFVHLQIHSYNVCVVAMEFWK